jgi:hypothetical protein
VNSLAQKKKKKKRKKVAKKKFLRDAFVLEQKLLQTKLSLATQSVTHPGTKGEVNERHFIETLRKYLPQRYVIDGAIVIDSKGATSDQIDVVVFDNQFSPTLLDQERHRYVPAEAVYAVFEVKPKITKATVEYASKKAESVRKLVRTSVPIVHAGGEFAAKEPFPIIAGLIASDIGWKNGFLSPAFQTLFNKFNSRNCLDCGLAVSGHSFDAFDGRINANTAKNSLAYFLFRLIDKLRMLGTAPAIDWSAYASSLGTKSTKLIE